MKAKLVTENMKAKLVTENLFQSKDKKDIEGQLFWNWEYESNIPKVVRVLDIFESGLGVLKVTYLDLVQNQKYIRNFSSFTKEFRPIAEKQKEQWKSLYYTMQSELSKYQKIIDEL